MIELNLRYLLPFLSQQIQKINHKKANNSQTKTQGRFRVPLVGQDIGLDNRDHIFMAVCQKALVPKQLKDISLSPTTRQ